jgi:hypothetical protein
MPTTYIRKDLLIQRFKPETYSFSERITSKNHKLYFSNGLAVFLEAYDSAENSVVFGRAIQYERVIEDMKYFMTPDAALDWTQQIVDTYGPPPQS